MNFFKNRFVAVVLCIILVFAATGVSVKVKLQSKCDEVINEFYTGVNYDGEDHAAIYDQLRDLSSVADGMCIIAGNYGIDTEDVKDYNEWLELALAYSEKDISYIYNEYYGLWTSLKAMEDTLNHTDLSERHTTQMESYSARLDAIDENIYSAGYNEEVRAFLLEYDRFPTSSLAYQFNVQMPEYFA